MEILKSLKGHEELRSQQAVCKVCDAKLHFLRRIVYDGLITWCGQACTELPNAVGPAALSNEGVTVPSCIS